MFDLYLSAISPQGPSPKPVPPTPSAGGKKVPTENYLGCYIDHKSAELSSTKELVCDLNATVVASSACSNADKNQPGPLNLASIVTNEM
jgi:hypothetical protein